MKMNLDRFIFVFTVGLTGFWGVWAIASQIAVFLGATFPFFYVVFLLAVCAGTGIAAVAGRTSNLYPVPAQDIPITSDPKRIVAGFLGAGFVLALGLAGSYFLKQPVLFFSITAGVSLFGIWWTWREPAPNASDPHFRAPDLAPYQIWITLGLLVLAAFLPLVLHRSDADDANFLNLATGMIADPRSVMMFDTMIGDPEQLIHLPTYRVETYHILNAVIAQLTGLSVIQSAHLILPAFSSVFLVCIYLLFCRMLAKNWWLVALLAGLAIIVVLGLSHNSFGNFSFMRLQHGKSLLFVGIVPLIYGCVLRAWNSRQMFDYALLFLTVAAATSLSANGIFLAPLAVFVAASGLLIFQPERIGAYVAIGMACSWPVVLGGVVLLTTGAYPSEFTEPRPMLPDVVGVYGFVLAPAILALCAGWALLEGQARRFFLGAFFVYTLTALNPFLSSVFAEHLTGNLNWRLMFAFPLPLFAGLAIAAGLERISVDIRLASYAALAVLLLIAFSPASIFGARNYVRFDPFGLDVPPEAYRVAEAVNPHLSRQGTTLAPEEIAIWLATFEDPAQQVAVRFLYLDHYRHTRSDADIDLRRRAFQAVTGNGEMDKSTEAVLQAVSQFDVVNVVVAESNAHYDLVKEALAGAGFVTVTAQDGYTLFHMPEA